METNGQVFFEGGERLAAADERRRLAEAEVELHARNIEEIQAQLADARAELERIQA